MRFWNHAAGEPWAITEPALNNILTIASRQNETIEAISAKLGRELDNTYVTENREGVAIILVGGESLFLRKLVLGIPAQASGKNLTRPPMPLAPRFVLVTSSRPNKGSEHWLQMT